LTCLTRPAKIRMRLGRPGIVSTRGRTPQGCRRRIRMRRMTSIAVRACRHLQPETFQTPHPVSDAYESGIQQREKQGRLRSNPDKGCIRLRASFWTISRSTLEYVGSQVVGRISVEVRSRSGLHCSLLARTSLWPRSNGPCGDPESNEQVSSKESQPQSR